MARNRSLVFAWSLLAACSCDQDPPGLVAQKGVLSLDPESIDFGAIDTGVLAKRSFQAINTGEGALVIATIELEPAGTPFRISPQDSTALPPSALKMFEVELLTATAGSFEATIVMTHDGEGAAKRIPLRGLVQDATPPPPEVKSFAVEPVRIDFGTMDEGTLSARGFEIENTGTVPVTITSAALELDAGNAFSVTPARTFPATLAANERMFVEVAFRGQVPGAAIDRVKVIGDAGEAMIELSAESAGSDLEVRPQAIDFGAVEVGGLAVRKRAAIANTGNRPLEVNALVFESLTAELAFEHDPALVFPTMIAPGAAIEVTFAYHPLDAGDDVASLLILSNDRDEGSLRVPVHGAGGTPVSCSIRATPLPLSFGNVERGRRSSLGVALANVGPAPCPLAGVFAGGDPAFAIAPLAPIGIASGEAAHALAEYFPHAYGEHAGYFDVWVGSPIDTGFRVPMSGASRATEIVVLPAEVDVGIIPLACTSEERRVRIYNTGDDDEELVTVYLAPGTSPEFSVELDGFHAPEEIDDDDDDYLQMFVRYRPIDSGIDTGAIVLEHTGAAAPVIVPLFGEGRALAEVREEFVAAARTKADLLIVADSSDSMDEDRALFAAALPSFLAAADLSGVDYRIAVTTMDTSSGGERGRFVGGVIEPTTPNKTAVLAASFAPGQDGDGDEEGLEAVRLALSDPLAFADNAAFKRDDVPLVVLFFSDEDDDSERPRSLYRDLFGAIAGHGRRGTAIASALVGTEDGDCDSPHGDADFGEDYLAIVAATGGRAESICDATFDAALGRIADDTFGAQKFFPLRSKPVAATIGVTVGGATAAWSYDANANAIRFETAPAAGANIEVRYSAACE